MSARLLTSRMLVLCLALTAALCAQIALATPARAAGFGFAPGPEGLSVSANGEGDTPATQGGSHPVALSTTVNLNPGAESPGEPGVPFSEGDLRTLTLELPPGLIENPAAVPQCAQADFRTPRTSSFETSLSGESCPDRTQIGTITVRSSFSGGTSRTFGVFNLVPPPGTPSELGASPYGEPITFAPHVRQADGEYGLTLESSDVPQLTNISGLTLNVWGAPWAILHNHQRGNCLNEEEPAFGWAKCSVGPPAANPPIAYLTLPTACQSSLTVTATATSWGNPTRSDSRSAQIGNLAGCAKSPFEPQAAGIVINPRAASPSGFDFDLSVDQGGFLERNRVAPSPAKKAVVSLPDGLTINPSVGAGLGVCSPAQYAAETLTSLEGSACPNESKIGDFTVKTPLLPETIEGSLFLAKPYENPFNSLIAIYLVAKSTERGILVKVAGRVDADPASGNLVATFDNLPQLPYTDLKVHFRESQRSPLATPEACGPYKTTTELHPWRDPSLTDRDNTTTTISSGPGGGPCPAQPTPFHPQAKGGSINSNAGSVTPFYLHLTRTDVEQEITSYSTVLPPGLTGKLAGIPHCSNAAIEAAKHRGGFEEAANPSCPKASQIGRTYSGFGVGQVLSYAPGGLYLAGPFHGSPFSIVAIDSATVGPFDLGVIIVRSAIKVDPRTAQVSIDSAGSDPIPHIIRGIPIHLRDVRVYIDRPGFTLNPTSCDPFSIASTLSGSGQVFGNTADDQSATATSAYQVFNCPSLNFKPRFSLKLRGGTKRGDYPSLRAEVRPRPGNANIGAATVTLPASEFLAQNHIETICTPNQYARSICPPGSVYGHARAFTPLLGAPLEGNVYLRTSTHELPDLVAALRGGGEEIAIDLVGQIDSVGGGLRARFDTVPDAPVTKFVMKLRGGKHGLLVNSVNVCSQKRYAKTRFLGHNNLGATPKTVLEAQCSKKKQGKKKKHAKHGGQK